MTLSILVTIDTESYAKGHPEQQIWGRMPDGAEFGIRAIMDVLERHGAPGTFYVNVYEAGRHGEDRLREVIRAIHERGHEVELHTHPRDIFGLDKLTRADIARQREILAWGKAFVERETGLPLLAHRAGAFAANLDTIKALKDIGIPVDASLSPAWFESHLAREVDAPNRPFMLDGILELPVTYYVQARVGTRRFIRLVDIEACSLRELKSIVRQGVAAGVPSINLLLHSHSFVRGGHGDLRLLRRLERFMAFVASEPGVQAHATRDFHARWQAENLAIAAAPLFTPYTGWWLTYLRFVESANRGWRNAVAALAPPALVAAALAAALLHGIG